MDEPFVVFLIGMRINSYWRVHEWVPIAGSMPRMLRELEAAEHSGLLHFETAVTPRTILMIQYWDSFESVREYARDPLQEHVPAWVEYNRTSGRSGGVGIFHETYLVDPDDCETVYNNMPEFGLGSAGTLEPAVGKSETAGKRLGTVDDELVVPADGSTGDTAPDDRPTEASTDEGEPRSLIRRLGARLPF
ncbi:DUF4188 domain-containing protein [Halobaculum litoreum]|uniref:DUF4188 domain-containing protein n=1 Tax=Halobaculum litoreum TaxID=3031998 RepID=A0ABD5XS96_9EURY